MTFPWEASAGTRPWELAIAGATLFPRVITIKRLPVVSAVGALPYEGATEAAETIIASGVLANIEIAASGRNTAQGDLPGDSPGPIKWTVTLPPSVIATLPSLAERDIIYDDLGRRFQISAFQPTGLGARIDAVRLLT